MCLSSAAHECEDIDLVYAWDVGHNQVGARNRPAQNGMRELDHAIVRVGQQAVLHELPQNACHAFPGSTTAGRKLELLASEPWSQDEGAHALLASRKASSSSNVRRIVSPLSSSSTPKALSISAPWNPWLASSAARRLISFTASGSSTTRARSGWTRVAGLR